MPDFRKPVRKYSVPAEQYGAVAKDYSQAPNQYGAPTPDAPAGIDELARLGANMVPEEEDPWAREHPKTIEERIRAKRFGTALGGAQAQNPETVQTGPGTYHMPAPTGHGGWRDSLTPDEAWIIQRESGFDPNAWNETVVYDQGRRLGNAHGLGQIVSDIPRDQRSTDPNEQLAAFRTYVANRYTTTANAVAFWKANGWY